MGKYWEHEDGKLTLGFHSEGGGWYIEMLDDGCYFLYEVPQFGGEPRYDGNYSNLGDAISVAKRWT